MSDVIWSYMTNGMGTVAGADGKKKKPPVPMDEVEILYNIFLALGQVHYETRLSKYAALNKPFGSALEAFEAFFEKKYGEAEWHKKHYDYGK